ncbi:hypothetical protein [Membranihabitans maritimus]|uniref:hypothetical protein n=1 Tax=Membranihabitans maritimus TaxID=2904244 RepID=UPI001F4512D0|nr:hypothetical protein [Membranihabitans maritimus]
MGILKVNLKRDTVTNTVKVGFYNLQGYELELLEILSLTNGKWEKNAGKESMDFFVDFRINENGLYPEIITIAAQSSSPECIVTEDLIKKLSKLLRRKKYRKAKKLYSILNQRNPYSKDYIAVKKLLAENGY